MIQWINLWLLSYARLWKPLRYCLKFCPLWLWISGSCIESACRWAGQITGYKIVWKRNELWQVATFTQALGRCFHTRGTGPVSVEYVACVISGWFPSIFKVLLAERSQWSFLSRGMMMKTVVKDYLDNNKLDRWQERENPKKAAQQCKSYVLSWEKEKVAVARKSEEASWTEWKLIWVLKDAKKIERGMRGSF